MQIDDTFRVDVPVDEAWRILLDIERIAPCLPGAQLQEIEGDEYRGVVKVKVGPITAQYKGAAKLESVDDAAHTAILVGSGRDTRGQGNASATIKLSLTPDGTGTRVDVDTDLSITGKVAQFGRGVMADVSTKLLAQFVDNLERDVLRPDVVDLTSPEPGEAAAGAEADESEGSDELVAEAVASGAEPAASPSGNGAAVRRVDSAEAEPVDLLEVGGTPVLRRLAPLLGIVVVLVLLRRLRRRRRS
ncbi:MAG TPA: SRPBCC family protein [Acidimicrobiia bacterium]